MPRMTAVASLAANTTSDNVLAGKLHEFIGGPAAAVSVHAAASAAGMHVTCLIGNRTIIDDQEISSANRFPIIPDDTIFSGEAGMGGERLTVRFRNSTAGALTYNLAVDVEYL